MAERIIHMIAHRGYSGAFPENTEQAFIGAAAHGSDGAETDVRVTKDGVLVLSHNETAVFEDGTELAIAESAFAALTEKPLKNDKTDQSAYLCTYRRYLEIMKAHDMICFVELKGTFTEEKVREVFELAEAVYQLDRCVLQSFEIENLIAARAMFPALQVMLTYGTAQRKWERCFEYGFSIDADWTVITPEMVSAFHERGLEVGLWTANTDDALAFCRSMGVDYIESDVYGG